MGVKFKGSFTSGTYFRTKVSNITLRVNCQSNSSKGRYTMGKGSVFAFGLLALTNQGRVVAVGWVIVGLPLIGRTLGSVRKRRNSQHSRGNGRSKVGNIGCTDSGLLTTGTAFLSWVPKLPVLGLLGR